MHVGYIITAVVYGLLAVPMFVLSIVHFYSGFYRFERETSPVIRALLLFTVLGAPLIIIRGIDPDGCFGAYNQSVRQWASQNTTSVILSAASLWLVQLFGSVSRLDGSAAAAAAANSSSSSLDPNSEKAVAAADAHKRDGTRRLHNGLAIVIIGEFATANIGCAIGQATQRYAPTSVFLVTSSALMIFLFAVMTYSAHHVRAAINRARKMHAAHGIGLGGGAEGGALSKLTDARRRLNVVHAVVTVLLVGCGVVNMVVFVTRVQSDDSFEEALTCHDPDSFSFDTMLWAQLIALVGQLLYTWQPLPCACAARFGRSALDRERSTAAPVRVRVRGDSYDGEASGDIDERGTGEVPHRPTALHHAQQQHSAALLGGAHDHSGGGYVPPALLPPQQHSASQPIGFTTSALPPSNSFTTNGAGSGVAPTLVLSPS